MSWYFLSLLLFFLVKQLYLTHLLDATTGNTALHPWLAVNHLKSYARFQSRSQFQTGVWTWIRQQKPRLCSSASVLVFVISSIICNHLKTHSLLLVSIALYRVYTVKRLFAICHGPSNKSSSRLCWVNCIAQNYNCKATMNTNSLFTLLLLIL